MINLPDPETLKANVSDGPQSWGDAFLTLATRTDDVTRMIENTNADNDALTEAYDRRIAKITEITGQVLPNPMRTAGDADREYANILASQASGGGFLPPAGTLNADFAKRQEEEFNERASALLEDYPALGPILRPGIMDERNQVMRDAQAKAGKAGQAPELGAAGRFTAQLLGGLQGAARDPTQWGMAMIGAGSSTAKTVAGRIGQTMVQEALLNGGQELVLQAASQDRKRQAGLEHGMKDALANAGIAATFGALFGGTVQGGAELAKIFKLGDGGAERAARVLDGKPEPGDVEAVAAAMGVTLDPDKLDLLNRSFEERILDDIMVPDDPNPAQMRVIEAARRYAEDPDNFPPPELVERMEAEREAQRLLTLTPDDYERIYGGGDANGIDDIADTFFADDVGQAARVIDDAALRATDTVDAGQATARAAADTGRAVQQVSERLNALENQTIAPPTRAEPLDDAAMRIAEEQAGELLDPVLDANGNAVNLYQYLPWTDSNGNAIPDMTVREALDLADEDNLHADLLEACKL
jgi:hypothetical protein